MKNFAQSIKTFLVSEDGPTAVEYAVMLALIIVGLLTAIGNLKGSVEGTFNKIKTDLDTANAAT